MVGTASRARRGDVVKWVLIVLLVTTLSGAGVAYASSLNVSSASVTVFKNTLVSPTLSVAPVETSIAAGGSASATATLSGYVGTPTGTVTFTVYTDSGCTTLHPTPSNVVTVTAPVTTSNSVTFATAGTYYWLAAYSGDGYNQPALSPCSSTGLTVTP
jgi:hypothetical protein